MLNSKKSENMAQKKLDAKFASGMSIAVLEDDVDKPKIGVS